MGLFDKRLSFKPFEYDLERWKSSLQFSYWLVSEFNFDRDYDAFHTKLTPLEQSVIKNTLLAISQIEVSVKGFWKNLGTRFPKAEFEQVGVVFAESEVRHSDAYSHLLTVLHLNENFSLLFDEPVIQGRVDYLTKYLKGASENSNENYALTLTLFSLFIENVSLFSQFVIIKSFSKSKNLLKSVDNVVQATQREEEIHALFGAWLVNQIRAEKPDWFTDEFYTKVVRASRKAFLHESNIIDWIFREGELDFLSKDALKEFIKDRLNQSVGMIGGPRVFEVDDALLAQTQWFREELLSDTNFDFFDRKPNTYSKKVQSITEEDLF